MGRHYRAIRPLLFSILSLDQSITPFIILATGLRLFVQSNAIPSEVHTRAESGLFSALNLIPVASSLVLLCRVAYVGLPPASSLLSLVIVSVVAYMVV